MDNIIELNRHRKPSAETVKLYRFGCDIDAALMDGLMQQHLPVQDVAGVIAHRLGNLLHCVDKREELLALCVKIMSEQTRAEKEKK
jgi:chemotaxis regulatin CheY-phosphate phosphatase CheZ